MELVTRILQGDYLASTDLLIGQKYKFKNHKHSFMYYWLCSVFFVIITIIAKHALASSPDPFPAFHCCTSPIFQSVLRTVKARGLVFCSQQSYQLVSVNYMIMNIISHTCAPHCPILCTEKVKRCCGKGDCQQTDPNNGGWNCSVGYMGYLARGCNAWNGVQFGGRPAMDETEAVPLTVVASSVGNFKVVFPEVDMWEYWEEVWDPIKSGAHKLQHCFLEDVGLTL